MEMSKELHTQPLERARMELLRKALHAFDLGDADLASRILIASYHHHTRQALSVSERLDLWWCLAWFAFYGGDIEKAELIVRRIIKLEQNLVRQRANKIIYAKYVLAIFCNSQQKQVDASSLRNEVLESIEELTMNESIKEILKAQIVSRTQSEETIFQMTAA